MDNLLRLLRIALSRGPVPTDDSAAISALGEKEWKEILSEAEKQSVTGLVFQAITVLGETVRLPDSLLFPLLAKISAIEKENRRLEDAAAAVTEVIEKAGLHPVVMKGPELSKMYPNPLWREYGDIDLYIPEGNAAAVIERCGFWVEKAPDGSFHFTFRNTDIDVHPDYFDIHGKGPKPKVPSPEATLLMLSAHTFKHAAGTGAGLRQVCDFAAAYSSLDGKYDPVLLKELFRKNGLGAWNELLMSFLSRYLGVRDNLYPRNRRSPKPLFRIISEGGNFGHHSPSRQKALKRSVFRRKASTAWRLLRRIPFALRYAPREGLARFTCLMKGNL